MTKKTLSADSSLLPMAMAFGGFALWTVADAIVRILRDEPTVLIVFLSGVFAVLFLCVFSRPLGGFRETFRRGRLGLRLLRGVVLAISNFLSFLAFSHLGLATAYAIIFASPLLAKVLSVFLMGEKIRLRSWAITLLGFAGVLIVLRPGIIPLNIGTAAALGLTFFFALGYILGRFIGEKDQTPLSLSLFQYGFVALGTAVPAYGAYVTAPPSMAVLAFTMVIGLCSILGSLLVSRAFMLAPAAVIAPVHYTQILWGLCFGAALFGEFPDGWTLLGAGVIIFAGLLLVRFSRPV